MSNNSNAFATISKKLCGVVFAASVAMIGNSALAQVFEETVPTKPTAAAFQMPTIKEVEKVDVAKLDMANIANEDLIREARRLDRLHFPRCRWWLEKCSRRLEWRIAALQRARRE